MYAKPERLKTWWRSIVVLCICALILASTSAGGASSQGWSELSIRLLSDEAFAIVEVTEGGRKTKHCPHHDHNDRLDTEQLIYVLGTIDAETWIDPDNAMRARKHLSQHYDAFMRRVRKDGLEEKVNINTARLTQLVRLPHVGPFIAVRIVEYRDSHPRFSALEQLRKIEGIGSETYNAIRHYLKL